jgi:hypothetical protein
MGIAGFQVHACKEHPRRSPYKLLERPGITLPRPSCQVFFGFVHLTVKTTMGAKARADQPIFSRPSTRTAHVAYLTRCLPITITDGIGSRLHQIRQRERRMTTTIMEFRIREEMAGVVLKEVAALEPEERLREAQAFRHALDRAIHDLEELWKSLHSGLAPADALALAQILSRSANWTASSLDLLVKESAELEAFKDASMVRLRRLKASAASLRRLVEIPAPIPDQARLSRSLDEMEKNIGIDPQQLLAELKA